MTLMFPEKQPGALSASFESPTAMTEGVIAFWREGFVVQSRMASAVLDFWLTPFRNGSADGVAAAPEAIVAPKLVLKTAAPVAPAPVAEPVVAHVAVASDGGEEPETDAAAPELFASPKGKADDLTRIKGIGPKLAGILNEAGVWHYSQIAGWTSGEATWINGKIGFGGRVQREGWQAQARALAAS
jgi:predicted flap endonuclease-1-like 5' DNA nuclease